MHEKIEVWVAVVWPAITFVLNAFFAVWSEERWVEWAEKHGFAGMCVLTLKGISQRYGADCGPDLHALRAKGKSDE